LRAFSFRLSLAVSDFWSISLGSRSETVEVEEEEDGSARAARGGRGGRGGTCHIDNGAGSTGRIDINPWSDIDCWIARGQADLLEFSLDKTGVFRGRCPDVHQGDILRGERDFCQIRH
jgi:hypothetical protein